MLAKREAMTLHNETVVLVKLTLNIPMIFSKGLIRKVVLKSLNL